MRITFERTAGEAGTPQDQFDLHADGKERTAARSVKATVQLRRLIDTTVRHAASGVFDTVFILDTTGNVIYQWTRKSEDDSEADLKITRLRELQVPRLFEGEVTLQASELMTTSRQMAVRIGDRKFQLFSIPVRSNVRISNSETRGATEAKEEPTAEQKALVGIPAIRGAPAPRRSTGRCA